MFRLRVSGASILKARFVCLCVQLPEPLLPRRAPRGVKHYHASEDETHHQIRYLTELRVL